MEDWNAEMQTKQLDEKWNKKAQHIAKQLGVPANIVSSEYVAMWTIRRSRDEWGCSNPEEVRDLCDLFLTVLDLSWMRKNKR